MALIDSKMQCATCHQVMNDDLKRDRPLQKPLLPSLLTSYFLLVREWNHGTLLMMCHDSITSYLPSKLID